MTIERINRALIDALPQMVGLLDAAAIVRYGNERWRTYTGTPIDEYGFPPATLLVDADDVEAIARIRAAIETDRDIRCEIRIRGRDGGFRLHEVRIVPLGDLGPRGPQWMFSCTDIEAQRTSLPALAALTARVALHTESENAAGARLREQERLMAIVEHMTNVGHWRLDLITNALYWSDDLYKTFGLPTTYTPTFETAASRFHPDDRDGMDASVQEAIAEAVPFTREARVIRPDGTLRDVIAYGQPECSLDGAVVAVVGCLQDVTAKKVAERERDRLSERVNLATQAAQVGIWDWNIRSGAVDWDATMFGLFGLDGAQGPATYERWAASLHDDDRAEVEHDLALAASSGTPFDTEFRVVWPNGEVHHIRAMGVVARDPNGFAERMIGTNWDVTAARTLADELRQEKDAAADAAAHDALTGLLNRRGLETWIDARPEPRATVLYLDVDGFKAVNDRGGHAAGDETLCVVARIIKRAVRGLDACARIGGDEFVVVLLGEIAPEVTRRIVARITADVDSLRPLGTSDDTRIGMSIGIGHVGGSASFTDALRDGDADLYRCKSERKKRAGIAQSGDGAAR